MGGHQGQLESWTEENTAPDFELGFSYLLIFHDCCGNTEYVDALGPITTALCLPSSMWHWNNFLKTERSKLINKKRR